MSICTECYSCCPCDIDFHKLAQAKLFANFSRAFSVCLRCPSSRCPSVLTLSVLTLSVRSHAIRPHASALNVRGDTSPCFLRPSDLSRCANAPLKPVMSVGQSVGLSRKPLTINPAHPLAYLALFNSMSRFEPQTIVLLCSFLSKLRNSDFILRLSIGIGPSVCRPSVYRSMLPILTCNFLSIRAGCAGCCTCRIDFH